MSDSERPMEESNTMNIFLEKFFKNSQVWQHDRMTLKAKIIPFFNNSRYYDRHIQVHKQEQGINNFCAGYSIKKLLAHLNPDLYSGRAKGHVWGILLMVTNDQF